MNMDAQMNIPICILAGRPPPLKKGPPSGLADDELTLSGHEKFEEMGKVVDVSSLYDAAPKAQQIASCGN